RLWLALDTSVLPKLHQPQASGVITRSVHLADARGRERAADFFRTVIGKHRHKLEAMGLLPRLLTPQNQSDPLLSDFSNPEASKNPWKGLVFMLASLSLVSQALQELRSAMTARSRTIVIVYSPNSG